jgi:hypothetical protein
LSNKLKCLAVGGEPATGKTTLMKTVYAEFENPQSLRFGLLCGHYEQKHNLALMGIYSGWTQESQVFEGTDRLSMAVNKDFLQYMEMKKRNILLEGDRLFSLNNLRAIQHLYHLRVIVLQQDEDTLHKRHLARGDTQSEKFLKGRKTKTQNILDAGDLNPEVYQLNEINDTIRLSNNIWSWLKADI